MLKNSNNTTVEERMSKRVPQRGLLLRPRQACLYNGGVL
ncbi:hypothetical protein A2U01_0112563, partial [Trifolium medium]|nr:hypothetical protein [Trifolium medium]